jgi:hypothetical protein
MIDTKIFRAHHLPAIALVLVAAACTWVWDRSAAKVTSEGATVILKVDTNHPRNYFARGAVGLSLESHELGTGRLTPRHSRLVRLMRLLGPSVLRIGGGSVDFSWWTSSGESPPRWARSTVTPDDLATLRALLAATGWRVLLGVDLGHFEPARAAAEARAAQEILGPALVGIEIGNEPNDYGHKPPNLRRATYSLGEYLGEASAYREALGKVAPGVAVYGPALTKDNTWLAELGSGANMFTNLTQHYYPIKACGPVSPPTGLRPTAGELLSPAVRAEEDQLLGGLAQAGQAASRPTRIGETNSVACPGNTDASPAFAGALWGFDWALRASSSGAEGVNFHGGLGICNSYTESPVCASNVKRASAGEIVAQPAYYGLLAARQLEGGRFVSTRVIGRGKLPNLTTWATITVGGTVKVAIDNMSATGPLLPVSISLAGYTASKQTLFAPSAEAGSHIAFGGASITAAGRWRPGRATAIGKGRSVRLLVPPASAVIVTLRPLRSRG